jgi:DpnII restriction endonuclease
MTKQQAVERLNRQISQIDELKKKERFSPEFKKWYRDTEIVIQKVFGEGTRHIKDFNEIYYSLSAWSDSTPDSAFQEAYTDGLECARSVLKSFIQEVEEYWEDKQEKKAQLSALEQLELLCSRFPLVARQIRSRHGNRETLNIEDEYDVQDLFHALLCLFFNDIRSEEWTPSYAGGSSRVDFLLKEEEIVVEIKKTRKGLGAKEIGEQLLIDIQRYQAHPSCRNLVCFVYDPDGRIANPRGIENDLNQERDGFKVRVYIMPKGI